MGANETGRVAESRSHDEGGGQRGRWKEVYGVCESEKRRRERAVYQLAESSLPDWLPSPCLFFPVHRFVLFYSRASNTRTRAQVDTYRSGCFVEGDVIDRQIYPGEFRFPGETYPFHARYTITCINTNDPDIPSFFFLLRRVLIVFATCMNEVAIRWLLSIGDVCKGSKEPFF